MQLLWMCTMFDINLTFCLGFRFFSFYIFVRSFNNFLAILQSYFQCEKRQHFRIHKNQNLIIDGRTELIIIRQIFLTEARAVDIVINMPNVYRQYTSFPIIFRSNVQNSEGRTVSSDLRNSIPNHISFQAIENHLFFRCNFIRSIDFHCF